MTRLFSQAMSPVPWRNGLTALFCEESLVFLCYQEKAGKLPDKALHLLFEEL